MLQYKQTITNNYIKQEVIDMIARKVYFSNDGKKPIIFGDWKEYSIYCGYTNGKKAYSLKLGYHARWEVKN